VHRHRRRGLVAVLLLGGGAAATVAARRYLFESGPQVPAGADLDEELAPQTPTAPSLPGSGYSASADAATPMDAEASQAADRDRAGSPSTRP